MIMYYRIERRYNLLRIDDAFATLQNISDDGTLRFEFRYVVKQSEVVSRKAMTVNVSVFSRVLKKRPILGISRLGKIDSREVVENILSDVTAAKTVKKGAEDFTLKTKVSDISAYVSNESVGALGAGHASFSTAPRVLRSVSAGSLKESVDPQPVLDAMNLRVENVYTKVSASMSEDTRSLCHDLILRRGIDPSDVTAMSSRSVTSSDAMHGTLPTSKRYEVDEGTLNRLHDHLTLSFASVRPEVLSSDVADNKLLNVIVSEPIDDIEVPVIMMITPPRKVMGGKDTTDVFVKFDLIDSATGSSIDSITRTLDISSHVRMYRMPVLPPYVKQVHSETSSHVNLEVSQQDPGANEVHVYKKNVYAADVSIDDYALVGVFSVTGTQRALIRVDASMNGTTLYRVIPAYSGIIGPAFTNVVVKSLRNRSIHAMSLTTRVVETGGISVEARKIPSDVISIQFMQRNLTIHESEFTPLGSAILVDATVRESDYIAYTTTSVLDDNVYEFTARVYRRTGLHEFISNDVIEYTLPNPGKVFITISNLNVSHDTVPNVTFTVDMSVVDSDIDMIKSLLEKQGLLTYFDADVARQREQLKGLLAYAIERVDLTTGMKDDMGTLTAAEFSDVDTRKKLAIDPLRYGHKYRYIISALMRVPETVLETLVKTTTDKVTKKEYSYHPAKFRHPVVLKRGIMMSALGLATRYAKSMFAFGSLGSSVMVEVSFDDVQLHIVDAMAANFGRDLHVITWKVDGDLSAIDHFVVMKKTHGIATILGTAHNLFTNGNCRWLYRPTHRDVGDVRYVIVPIMCDYKRGESVMTNILHVDAA